MRPCRLVVENFGAYHERTEVDFSSLGPIFLVWGKTGSGKTTLFDAIAYALYGAAPGSRSGLEKQLASHYMKSGERPVVEFEFSLGAERLRATRTPPFKREKRGGGETEVPPSARLERQREGSWELVAEKIGEVDEAVRSRLGLSADEFSKIILLPQGEFQRFLEMDSSDRVEILEKLFPVDLHEALTSLARERARAAAEEQRRVDAELARLEAEAGQGELSAALARAAGLETERRGALEALREADAALARGRGIRQRQEAVLKAQAALENVEAAAMDSESRKARILRAKRAQPCLALLEASERARSAELQLAEERGRLAAGLSALEASRAEIEARRQAALEAEGRMGLLEREYGELEARRAAWLAAQEAVAGEAQARAACRRGSEVAARAREAEARAREALAALTMGAEEEARISEDFAKAREALEAWKAALRLAGEAEAARGAAAESRKALSGAEAAAARMYETLAAMEEERERAAAADIARLLLPGEPCPVCGSREHPALRGETAERHEDLPESPAGAGGSPSAEELKRLREEREGFLATAAAARARAEKEDAAVGSALAALEALLPSLEEAGQEPESAGALREALGEALRGGAIAGGLARKARAGLEGASARASRGAAATREILERRRAAEGAAAELEAARGARARADEAEASLRIELARREEGLAKARERAGNEDPRPRLEALAKERDSLELARREARARIEAWEGERQRLLALHSAAESRLPRLSEETARSSADLAAALSASGFGDSEALRSAALSREVLEALEAADLAYERERAAARAAWEEASRSLGPDSAAEVDISALESASLGAAERLEAIQADLGEAKALTSRLSRVASERERLGAERVRVAERAGRLQGLSALLSGELSGRRLPFKNYVLGAYFRRVVELAGIRLSEMSDGRYGLIASESGAGARGRIGLELLVRDAYTGRTRPAGTLSGGERFLSSLALALGLSDAIRSRSGGVDLDAVFIDEGFGSLDEEALDRAIAALDRARGARTIGIVSHVAELRNRIPSRIEVRKGREGSSLSVLS